MSDGKCLVSTLLIFGLCFHSMADKVKSEAKTHNTASKKIGGGETLQKPLPPHVKLNKSGKGEAPDFVNHLIKNLETSIGRAEKRRADVASQLDGEAEVKRLGELYDKAAVLRGEALALLNKTAKEKIIKDVAAYRADKEKVKELSAAAEALEMRGRLLERASSARKLLANQVKMAKMLGDDASAPQAAAAVAAAQQAADYWLETEKALPDDCGIDAVREALIKGEALRGKALASVKARGMAISENRLMKLAREFESDDFKKLAEECRSVNRQIIDKSKMREELLAEIKILEMRRRSLDRRCSLLEQDLNRARAKKEMEEKARKNTEELKKRISAELEKKRASTTPEPNIKPASTPDNAGKTE